MSKINTNMAGVTTLYHLQNKEEGMNKALERISSGLRLNHAVDDAAGASIVNRMTSQIKGLEAAIRNAADAISLTQTAEGAIEEVTQILHRMRELSVQSANGVYTGQDRQAIQNEVGALQEELTRIAESSTFNGVKMLNGSFLDTTFQVGFQPNDTATLSIEDVKPTGLGEYILSTSVTNAENYLQTESEPLVAGTTSQSVESMGTIVNLSVYEEDANLSIHTIDQIVNSNDVSGIATDALKSFVAADTGTNGAFALEAVDGQSGSSVDTRFFEINAATGEIRLANGISELDFEDRASFTGDNNYEFNVVYTNSEGVRFQEKISLNLGNHLNSEGTTTAEIKTNTADGSPKTQIPIADFSPDLLNQAVEMGMVVNADGSLDTTNFTGLFRVASATPGVAVSSSTGMVSIDTANDAANPLGTGSPQTFNVLLLDANLETVYDETVTLSVTDASGEFATRDKLIQSPSTEVIARANTTNISITTDTASGVPARQISGASLLPADVNPATLGFDDDTSFVANPALNGATVVSNGDGTFDVRFVTDNTTTPGTDKLATAPSNQTLTIEARDTRTNPVLQPSGNAQPASTRSRTTAAVITQDPATTSLTLTEADLTNNAGSTAIGNAIADAVANTANLSASLNGAPAGVTLTNDGSRANGVYDFDITLDLQAPSYLAAGNYTFEVQYEDRNGAVVYTETVEMSVTDYVQHTFTINLDVSDGAGQGAETGEFAVVTRTDNDNAFPVNAITAGAAAGAGDTASASILDIQTNAPTGSVPFTFDETDVTDNSAAAAITGIGGTARYALGASTPAGVTLLDNLDGTFDVTINVDPNGEMLPVDATSFDIEISDSANPGTVVYTETINLNVTDLKQNVVLRSQIEDRVGQISVQFDNVLEAGKVRIPADKQSAEMTAFIKENPGGVFTLAGDAADKFRINAQTGEVISKSFMHFNSTDADLNNYGVDIIYTAGTNSFTDKANITIVNSEADDNPTQAAGRPLVGADAIEAASLVSEEEDLTIYGNVGTAEIDVNGRASAYELVQAINSRQGETGVYANANTRVNISFPDQFEASDDAISFMLQGMNDEPILVSGNVEFGIVGGRDANVRGLADAINSVSGKTGISAKVSPNGSTLHMMSNEGHDILVENFTMSVQNIPMNISATDDELNSIGDVQQLVRGQDDTFRSTGEITFHSPYVFSIETSLTGINGGGLFQLTPGAAKLVSVSELDVLTVDNAKKMLTAVDAALVRIDLERSDLGATMSRMEHTIRNLSNIVVNTKAARSRIQDANIAEETTNMTKAQVLSQAAQAMLAQANRTSQSILSLLQG